ncbi:MAG: phosphonate metabolism protein/1,5-bisphosphokinase (PRPP-forming) PhnN [Pseudomonadota bacterium]
MAGWLIQVTGPSGVGKDTLLVGARAALAETPGLHFVRRVITRPADAGGEAHEAMSEADFDRAVAEGQFFAWWRAHGLGYGVPGAVAGRLAAGETVVLNGSRAAAAGVAARWPQGLMVGIDAPPAVLAARLAARGREDAAAIAQRRARSVPLPPEGLPRVTLMNDGTVEEGVARLTAVIRRLHGGDLSGALAVAEAAEGTA